MQRHADAADEPPIYWLLGQQRIEDVTGGKGAAYAAHTNLAELGIDADLDEDRAVSHAGGGKGLKCCVAALSPSAASASVTDRAPAGPSAVRLHCRRLQIVSSSNSNPPAACRKRRGGIGQSAIFASVVREVDVASSTAGEMLAVTWEPPENGPSGSNVSPSSTVTLLMAMPRP